MAHMGSTWVLSAPGGPHVGPTNLLSGSVICVPVSAVEPYITGKAGKWKNRKGPNGHDFVGQVGKSMKTGQLDHTFAS